MIRIAIDNTDGPIQTDRQVVIGLDDGQVDLDQFAVGGTDLQALDSDQTTSLSPVLLGWQSSYGLRFLRRIRIPETPVGSPEDYLYASGLAVDLLDHATEKRIIIGCGSNIPDGSSTAYGTFGCFDQEGNELWRHDSPNVDYGMGCSIGDIDDDGDNEVAVGYRAVDKMGKLLDHLGNEIWRYTIGVYCRIAEIGKLRNDLTGKQVLFGGAEGVLALCDKDGTELWKVDLGSGFFTLQAARIGDYDNSGTPYAYVAVNQSVLKISGADGSVVANGSAGMLADPWAYGIDVGNITSTTTKQIVVAQGLLPTLDADKIPMGNIVVYDAAMALQWARAIRYPTYSVCCGDLDGDGYDEIVACWGTHQNAAPPEYGWGGLILLDRHGEEIASVSIGSSVKFSTIRNGKVYATCDDGYCYIYELQPVGASVRVTIPSVPADDTKTIYLDTGGTTIPEWGDGFADDFSGGIPAGWVQERGVWTTSGTALLSPDDGNTSDVRILRTDIPASEGVEIECELVKVAQGTGSSFDYYHLIYYRATNFVDGYPDAYAVVLGAKGNGQLLRYASGTASMGGTAYVAESFTGPTFNTTDVLRVRIVANLDHHVCEYSRNGGTWTRLYHHEETNANRITSAAGGVFAIGSNRGQTQVDSIQVLSVPSVTATGIDDDGPAPIAYLIPPSVGTLSVTADDATLSATATATAPGSVGTLNVTTDDATFAGTATATIPGSVGTLAVTSGAATFSGTATAGGPPPSAGTLIITTIATFAGTVEAVAPGSIGTLAVTTTALFSGSAQAITPGDAVGMLAVTTEDSTFAGVVDVVPPASVSTLSVTTDDATFSATATATTINAVGTLDVTTDDAVLVGSVGLVPPVARVRGQVVNLGASTRFYVEIR